MVARSLLLFAVLSSSITAAEKRFVLTSAQKNISRRAFSTSGKGWSVTKKILHGGKQEGVELVIVDNGAIRIAVCPTRGMGIIDIRDSKTGKRVWGWDSPVKETVHPRYIDLESRGGLGWLEGFNEWLVRCGLEFAGHPGTDAIPTNTGETKPLDLTLHGKIGNIPASEVEVIIDDSTPPRIRVRGIVHERLFFGPKLKLVAEVSTTPGSKQFRIDDSVSNEGADDQEFQIIYHANFGNPLLEKDARVVTPAKLVVPMNANAAKSIDSWTTYRGPTKGFDEEVYLVTPYARDGRTSVLLHNASKTQAARIDWSVAQLPYLTVWKNTPPRKNGYVTGLEPATGFPFNRRVERHYGRVPKLKAGQTRKFSLLFSIIEGQSPVGQAIKDVEAIQGDRKTTVSKTPPAIPPMPTK